MVGKDATARALFTTGLSEQGENEYTTIYIHAIVQNVVRHPMFLHTNVFYFILYKYIHYALYGVHRGENIQVHTH